MVHLDTILEGLVEGCKQSGKLPDAVTYSTIVLDNEGAHSDIRPPVIEFSVDTIQRNTSRNTERVGQYVNGGTDNGFIYTQWFDARITAEVLSVENTSYTHRGLEEKLRTALYKFDSHGARRMPPDPDDTTNQLYDISKISLRTVEPQQQFNLQPSVRTRQVPIDIEFTHEITSEDLGESYNEAQDVDVTIEAVIS